MIPVKYSIEFIEKILLFIIIPCLILAILFTLYIFTYSWYLIHLYVVKEIGFPYNLPLLLILFHVDNILYHCVLSIKKIFE